LDPKNKVENAKPRRKIKYKVKDKKINFCKVILPVLTVSPYKSGTWRYLIVRGEAFGLFVWTCES